MRSRKLRSLLVSPITLFACVGWGCARDTSYRPDVLVIVVDTLRADHLPFYGYDIDTAPFLAEWAKRSVVFDNAWSTSSHTAPATASILTGVYPVQHGVRKGLADARFLAKGGGVLEPDRVPHDLETLAELLRGVGYRTFGVADNPNVSSAQGYADGFEHFENFAYAGAAQVNATVESWQAELARADPWFVYLHYMDPHEPYHGREKRSKTGHTEREYRIYAYDSEIRLVDEHLREAFEQLGVDDDTVVVFTSDHGEEFWDHGSTSHVLKLYSELTHVPLFVRRPGIRPRRVDANVSIVDLLPTLRSILGLPPSPQDVGIDLMQLAAEDDEGSVQRPVFASRHALVKRRRFVVRGDYKLIQNQRGRNELYDLAADPNERRNLATERPELVDELSGISLDFARSTQRWQSTRVRIEADDEHLRRLEELGYVESEQ